MIDNIAIYSRRLSTRMQNSKQDCLPTPQPIKMIESQMELDREENNVSLFDLLILAAENLKLLVLGPLVAGLMALSFGFTLPLTFTSEAVLSIPLPVSTQTQTSAQAAVLMVSPVVLDSIIGASSLSPAQSRGAASRKLASQIKAVVGKDGLLRLDVTADTPASAQKLADAVIDSWLKSTGPTLQDRADLEVRLEYAKVSLESVRRLIDRIAVDGPASLTKPVTRGDLSASVVALGELQARYLGDTLTIPRLLRGLTRDVVLQPPTLPTEATSPKKTLMAVLSALSCGFALLLWVFVRQAWKTDAQDRQLLEKTSRLRKALGFKAQSS